MVQLGHALHAVESCASEACQEKGETERDKVYKEPVEFPHRGKDAHNDYDDR